MSSKIPIPDTHPNVPWKVPHNGKVEFEFSKDVDSFEVDQPGYFDPAVQPGPRKNGDKIKCTATAKDKTAVFNYHPDTTATLADSHTILIGN